MMSSIPSYWVNVNDDGETFTYVNLLENKKYHYKRGKLHCLNEPAVKCTDEISDYIEEWWFEGYRHRINGPAVDGPNTKTYYCNGKYLGIGDEGFWNLWDLLSFDQQNDSILLLYLPKI